ncbi:hypothetical protein C6Y40_14305, partial [Alteromonas alba]
MQRILMVGKPNCGKSLLFNQLTGLRQKVANYPGITVEVTRGKFDKFELVDLPGAYSLNGLTRDEVIAVEEIKGSLADEDTRVVLVVLDATRLAQSLILGLQVKQLAAAQSKPVMFALNFIDEVKRVGEHIDSEGLSNALGSPVMPLSARSLDGLHEFKHALLSMADWPNVHDNKQQPALDYSDVATRSQALASEFHLHCEHCHTDAIAYNSCRNRHCPKCQGSSAKRWFAAREQQLLPVEYYHVVFTLPGEVAQLAFYNKAQMYQLLFKAASQTLLTIAGDTRHLGAEVGTTMVLHTWGS